MGARFYTQLHHNKAKATKIFFQDKKSNKVTLDAMWASKEEKGTKCDSIEDFWEKMGMNPNT